MPGRKCLVGKLLSYETGSKLFWTTFKRRVNKKQITNIPPLDEGNSVVSDFQQKANIFNYYFSNQCSRFLPFYPRTESKLFMVNTSEEKIFSIIWSLNSKKRMVMTVFQLTCLNNVPRCRGTS